MAEKAAGYLPNVSCVTLDDGGGCAGGVRWCGCCAAPSVQPRTRRCCWPPSTASTSSHPCPRSRHSYWTFLRPALSHPNIDKYALPSINGQAGFTASAANGRFASVDLRNLAECFPSPATHVGKTSTTGRSQPAVRCCQRLVMDQEKRDEWVSFERLDVEQLIDNMDHSLQQYVVELARDGKLAYGS